MKKFLLISFAALLGVAAASCASSQSSPKMSEGQAMQEAKQLMTLYHEARTKFVVQLQKLEQAEECSRADALHSAMQEIKAEADMSPEPSKDIDIVAMELAEAAKKCHNK